MQSWILVFALVFATGSAAAEDVNISAPDTVPPIPSPWEPLEATTPIDGPWPAAPSETASVVDEDGAPVTVPAIPAPSFASATALENADATQSVADATQGVADATQSVADATQGVADATESVAEAPAPEKVRPPFDPAGTIHVVEKGDTLWDISDLYLGTPWIWPSVWRDNEDIENPHLILPGDKIWVSATEMRKVSDEEAAALLAARDAAGDLEPMPAAMAEDAPSVPMATAPKQYFHYPEISTVGLVRKKELRGLAQIVGTTEEQIFLSQGDVVFVDLGEQDTAVGDEFVVFRTSETVYDPATRRPIGEHTEILGWLEITEVYGASARAKLRMTYADFVPGVYLKPREVVSNEIEIRSSPVGVEGQLADLLLNPKYNAGGDVVVLNRGSEHGLEAGSTLEIYRPISVGWKENWYGDMPDVEIPHDVIAQMLVLSVQPTTAMAYVGRSSTELWYGDRFRTVGGPSVEWPEGGLFVLARLKGLMASVPKPNLGVPDMPKVDVPGVDSSDWNVPRLSLPSLDAYDPR